MVETENRQMLSIPKVEATFRTTRQRIFTSLEIAQFIDRHIEAWVVFRSDGNGKPQTKRESVLIPLDSPRQTNILKVLLARTKLRKERLAFPYRAETRFTWGEVPTYALIQSLNEDGYFSHYTAMHFHGLSEQIPKTIYFNIEQPASSGGGTLSQEGIDRAFKGKCRVSTNVVALRDTRIHKLNGGNTGRLGVVPFTTEGGEQIRITNIERTLIDAVVRPVYAGGVAEVAAAFRAAAKLVSVKRLASYLRKLNYTYPYHQAIGYYLDRAGVFNESDINLLRKLPIEFDFYLNYQIKNPAYNEKWRLWVPQRF
jgi:hypothetical protein